MTYVTMGNEIPSGTWVWEQRDIVVSEEGTVSLRTLRNGTTSESCSQVMRPADVRRLLRSVTEILDGVPEEVGRFATDTDSGVIRFRDGTGVRQVRFEGAYRAADELAAVYRAIDLILAKTEARRP